MDEETGTAERWETGSIQTLMDDIIDRVKGEEGQRVVGQEDEDGEVGGEVVDEETIEAEGKEEEEEDEEKEGDEDSNSLRTQGWGGGGGTVGSGKSRVEMEVARLAKEASGFLEEEEREGVQERREEEGEERAEQNKGKKKRRRRKKEEASTTHKRDYTELPFRSQPIMRAKKRSPATPIVEALSQAQWWCSLDIHFRLQKLARLRLLPRIFGQEFGGVFLQK